MTMLRKKLSKIKNYFAKNKNSNDFSVENVVGFLQERYKIEISAKTILSDIADLNYLRVVCVIEQRFDVVADKSTSPITTIGAFVKNARKFRPLEYCDLDSLLEDFSGVEITTQTIYNEVFRHCSANKFFSILAKDFDISDIRHFEIDGNKTTIKNLYHLLCFDYYPPYEQRLKKEEKIRTKVYESFAKICRLDIKKIHATKWMNVVNYKDVFTSLAYEYEAYIRPKDTKAISVAKMLEHFVEEIYERKYCYYIKRWPRFE